MERKLERCIRLRFVSLCTCVCTCMSMCGNDLPSFDQNKTSIDRRNKKTKYFCLLLLILLWELSLGGKLLPFLGGRRWRRGRHRRMPCRRRLLRWWELFVSKFCVCVCVLLASWWFKLSMRLLVFFSARRRETFRIRKGKPIRLY